MKTRKKVLNLLSAVPVISLVGISAFLVVAIITILGKGGGLILDFIGITGFTLFVLPIFLLQFVLPSKILGLVGIDTDVPIWGKVALYTFVFPFVTMVMVTIADTVFNFLPPVKLMHLADHSLRAIARQERMTQSLLVGGITYLSMVGGGIIFRLIFKKKIRAQNN